MHKLWSYISLVTILLVLMGVMVPQLECTNNDQQDTTSNGSNCISQLMPCLNFLNGTEDVPRTCCDPLESVIKYNLECICGLISNRGSREAEQAGINVNQAQQLPARCGLRVNPLSCLTRGTNDDQGSGNRNDSVDNSSSVFLMPSSMSLIVATTFFVFLHVFWFQRLCFE